MQVLQVKVYNQTVAAEKYSKANNKANCPRSMFFFTLTDQNGYATTDRKRGYIAFDNCRAVFGINPQSAIYNFKEA